MPSIYSANSLSCVCLNAHSVVSKRFDFVAFVSIWNFDIVAVTETFLHDSIHDCHISCSAMPC